MNKLLATIGLTLSLAFTLTGCELYFGKHNNGGDDGQPPGWSCETNADCAAGCYCDAASGKSGECTEAGFCDQNSDCPKGYVCDDRNSCVPDPGPQTCTTDYDCPAGSFCNGEMVCETSCVCNTDADAQAAGYQHCDEGRHTCKNENAGGTCGGEATCGTKPSCDAGSVPLVGLDGCYTGVCSTLGNCDVAPACTAYQHEADCLNPDDSTACSAIYNGINCTGTGPGGSCTTQDANCTCEYYVFAECH